MLNISKILNLENKPGNEMSNFASHLESYRPFSLEKVLLGYLCCIVHSHFAMKVCKRKVSRGKIGCTSLVPAITAADMMLKKGKRCLVKFKF